MERILFPVGTTLGSMWIAAMATWGTFDPFFHAIMISGGAWIGVALAAWCDRA